MAGITTKHLFHLALIADVAQSVGASPAGTRRVVPIIGGRFEGERMRGVVLPGGSDWITIRPDEAWQLDVRIVLKTDDDQLLTMAYRGLRHGPPEVMARVQRGEPADPATYYFRSIVTFETAATRYGWLNRIFAVGTGYRLPEGPCYDVFEIA